MRAAHSPDPWRLFQLPCGFGPEGGYQLARVMGGDEIVAGSWHDRHTLDRPPVLSAARLAVSSAGSGR